MAAGTAMFTGDFCCQCIEQSAWAAANASARHRKTLTTGDDVYHDLDFGVRWNATRSVRMGLTGCCVSGVISQLTYLWAARVVGGSVGRRVAAMTAIAPISITATQGSVAAQCSMPVADMASKLKRDVPPTFAANLIYWPPLLAAIVKFVSVPYQGVVGAGGWFVWSIVLSLYANNNG